MGTQDKNFRVKNGIDAGLTVTADKFVASNNGNGTNYQVGDDTWIGDINIANTMSVKGVQSALSGYIRFGSDTNGFGYNGTSLVYGSTVIPASATLLTSASTVSALTTVGTVTSGTWSGSFGAVSGANLTSLTAGNLSGTIPSGVLGNSTHYIGTTAIALNRASAAQSLTGITSIDGYLTKTNTGLTGNISFITPAASSQATWSGYAVGLGTMVASGSSANGTPSANFQYFLKVANRDTAGGWGGLSIDYSTGDLYTGLAGDNTVYATWYKVAQTASPTFTGTPLSTTAAADTNTTQIATTAYVVGQASATNPTALGTVAVGTSLKYARADHVHPTTGLATSGANSNITSLTGLTTPLSIAQGGTGTATAPTQYGVIYASSGTAYASTTAGVSTQVLIGNATGAPTWTNISGLSVSSATTATNLSGTTVSSLPYQSASGTTSYVSIGTAGQVLTVNGTANGYTWTSPLTNPMTTAGDIIYGGASGAATRLAGSGTNGYVLTYNTSTNAPQWSASASGVSASSTDTLTNKSLSDSTTWFVDSTDNTKRLNIDVTGTTGITGVLQTAFTTAKTVALQDVAGTVYVSTGTDVTLADGGTNASLTASNGGIVYSTASAMGILAGTATAGQMLQSGASTTPAWSTATFPSTATGTGTILRANGTNWVATTATYPTTTTANQILYSSAANTIGEITTANNQVLVTGASGIPAFSGTLPSGVTSSSLTSFGSSPTLTTPVINNIKLGYTTTVTSATAVTLTISSNRQQLFTGTLAQTIVLPVTSTLVAGMSYEIENNSTADLTVNSSGGNLVATVIPGVTAHLLCIGTTLTTAADWDVDFIGFSTLTGTGSNVLSASPSLTGTPLSTTAAADTNTTQIATTAYVVGQASATNPTALGTVAVGTSLKYARQDHVHPTTGLGLTSGTLGQFAATTSSQLAGVISDETGSGALVFGSAPTISLPAIDNFKLGFTSTATSAGTTTLTNASNNQQVFTGTTTHTVIMPVATTMTVGTRYLIENNSTQAVDVVTSASNPMTSIMPGTSIKITSILASGTTASSWDIEYVGFNNVTGTGGSLVMSTGPTISNTVLSGTLSAGGGVGTAGQMLTSTASGVAWASPGMTFISNTTFTSVSSISVNNCFTSTYDAYLIVFYASTSAQSAKMFMRVSGTDSATGYYDSTLATSGVGGATVTGSAQANVTTGWKPFTQGSQGNTVGQLVITNPAVAATTWYSANPSYFSTSGPSYGLNISTGNHTVATAYDGFTLTFIASSTGWIKVYGLRN